MFEITMSRNRSVLSNFSREKDQLSQLLNLSPNFSCDESYYIDVVKTFRNLIKNNCDTIFNNSLSKSIESFKSNADFNTFSTSLTQNCVNSFMLVPIKPKDHLMFGILREIDDKLSFIVVNKALSKNGNQYIEFTFNKDTFLNLHKDLQDFTKSQNDVYNLLFSKCDNFYKLNIVSGIQKENNCLVKESQTAIKFVYSTKDFSLEEFKELRSSTKNFHPKWSVPTSRIHEEYVEYLSSYNPKQRAELQKIFEIYQRNKTFRKRLKEGENFEIALKAVFGNTRNMCKSISFETLKKYSKEILEYEKKIHDSKMIKIFAGIHKYFENDDLSNKSDLKTLFKNFPLVSEQLSLKKASGLNHQNTSKLTPIELLPILEETKRFSLNNPYMSMYIGDTYRNLKNYDKAQKYYKIALQQDTRNEVFLYKNNLIQNEITKPTVHRLLHENISLYDYIQKTDLDDSVNQLLKATYSDNLNKDGLVIASVLKELINSKNETVSELVKFCSFLSILENNPLKIFVGNSLNGEDCSYLYKANNVHKSIFNKSIEKGGFNSKNNYIYVSLPQKPNGEHKKNFIKQNLLHEMTHATFKFLRSNSNIQNFSISKRYFYENPRFTRELYSNKEIKKAYNFVSKNIFKRIVHSNEYNSNEAYMCEELICDTIKALLYAQKHLERKTYVESSLKEPLDYINTILRPTIRKFI